MKIIIDLQGCQTESRFRGIGRYTHSLTKAFLKAASDHDVWLGLNSAFYESVSALRSEFSTLVPEERIFLYDVAPPVAQMNPSNHARGLASELVREHLLAGHNADIVWNASLFEGWVDDAVSSVGQIPTCAATAATLYDVIPFLRPETYLSDERYRAWYYRKWNFLQRTDLLFAISDYTRREGLECLQLSEDRIVAIGAGVDEAFCPQQLSDEQRIHLLTKLGIDKSFVFYTGGFDERKNVNQLIMAYARIPSQLRASHLLVIGGMITPDQRFDLLGKFRSAGLANTEVVLTGFLAEEELAACYSYCSAFVFPSMHEGFGLPIVEAMACGAPVLGADASSISEIIADKDALFDPNNVAQLAALLTRVLTDRFFADSLRERGTKRARFFSWKKVADLALQGLESHHSKKNLRQLGANAIKQGARPRLAYVSPLPPVRSGISDYSSQLLPSLSLYYDIDVIVDQNVLSDSRIKGAFTQRSIDWFEVHGKKYDRVLYHMGNSPFHAHMLALLKVVPGTVVLHDTYLTGITEWMAETSGQQSAYLQALYESHGFEALLSEQRYGRDYTRRQYPVSISIFKDAHGVLLHSDYALNLARHFYGPEMVDRCAIVPFPKPLARPDRSKARRMLGFAEDAFVVCTFGIIDPHKLNHRLLNAWFASVMADHAECRLIFVGQNHGGEYGRTILQTITRSVSGKQVTVTGFVEPQAYLDYLQAADLAVQLRTHSRGETSAAVFDCLAHGLPVIINAHATLNELPGNAVIKLNDEFTDSDLTDALNLLYTNRELREKLGQAGSALVLDRHQPSAVAKVYSQQIEHFWEHSHIAREERFYESFGCALGGNDIDHDDLASVASAIVHGRPRVGQKQILVDVSAIALDDLKSGIQRVVRNVLRYWAEETLVGYRVEPIRYVDGSYVYARSYMLGMLGLDQTLLIDEPVTVQGGDILLALDWAADMVASSEAQFQIWRERGVQIYFVVYDLLPLLRPEFFPPGSDGWFRQWLLVTARAGTGLVCISRSVSEELESWLNTAPIQRREPLRIGYFHLGVDPKPELDFSSDGNAAFESLHEGWPTVLMVGTVEPRKGHREAVHAFDQLWSKGACVNLIIIGRKGWLIDDLADSLLALQASGRPLVWLEGADDVTLEAAYKVSDILLAASEGEGFGLPLIEAAQHELDVLARDIPVFREVGGQHIRYFDNTPGALPVALGAWLESLQSPSAKRITGLRWLSWKQSADGLLKMILDKNHEGWTKKWRGGQANGHDFSQPLSVDLVRGQAEVALSGWATAEPWGRWSNAMRAKLSIVYKKSSLQKKPMGLRIEAEAFLNPQHPMQWFLLSANGVELLRWEWRLGQSADPIEVLIPESCVRREPMLNIVIECPDRIMPSSLGMAGDNRSLGIAVRSMLLGYDIIDTARFPSSN